MLIACSSFPCTFQLPLPVGLRYRQHLESVFQAEVRGSIGFVQYLRSMLLPMAPCVHSMVSVSSPQRYPAVIWAPCPPELIQRE